jgi:Rrf2 family protein
MDTEYLYFFIPKSTMVSVTTQHALRALTHLATLADGVAISGRDLAVATGIPVNYLSKILWTLGSEGVISATRGTGGGYRLGRPAGDVRLIEIVGLFDKARTASECFLDGAHPCSDATACVAHASWRGIKQAYLAFLETTTLASLAGGRARVHSRGGAR